MNKQILNHLGITEVMIETFCRKENLNINSMKVRKEFYRDVLDGKIIVEDGELIRKRVRTK